MLEQIERIGQEINASLAEVEPRRLERIRALGQELAEKHNEKIEHEGKEYTYRERYLIAVKKREEIRRTINTGLSADELVRIGNTLSVLESFITEYEETERTIETRKNEASIAAKDDKAIIIKNGINNIINVIEAEIARLVSIRSSVDLSGDDFREKLNELEELAKEEAELRAFLSEMNNLLSFDGINEAVISDLENEDYKKIIEEFYKVINTFEINMSKVVIKPKNIITFNIEEEIILDIDELEKEDNDKVARIDDIIAEVEKSSMTYSESANKFEEMLEISRTIKNEELRMEKTNEIEELRDLLIRDELKIIISDNETKVGTLARLAQDLQIEQLTEMLLNESYKNEIQILLNKRNEIYKAIDEINKKLDKALDGTISLKERIQSLDEAVDLISKSGAKEEDFMATIERARESISKKVEQEDNDKVARIDAIILKIEKSTKSYNELVDEFEEMLEISKTISNEELKFTKTAEILKLRDSKIEEEIDAKIENCDNTNIEEIKRKIEEIKHLIDLISDEETKKSLQKDMEDTEEFIRRKEEILEKYKMVNDTSLPLAQRKKHYEEVSKLANDLINDFEADEDEIDAILLKLEEELEEYEEKYNTIKDKVEDIIADKRLSDFDKVLVEVQTLGSADKMYFEKQLKEFYDDIVEEFEELVSKCEDIIVDNQILNEEEVRLIGKYYVYLSETRAEEYKKVVKAIISYHNKTKQNEVRVNYESKKDNFFTKVGKAVKFVNGSKLAANVRLSALNNLRSLYEECEEDEPEKEKISGLANKVEARLIDGSVIGGLRLFAAQKKLEKLKTKLYDEKKFTGYSVRKQNRLLRKQQKALNTIEKQMVKGLRVKSAIDFESKEYATSIIDQYLYLIATSPSKDEEGNFDLTVHIESLLEYLDQNEDLFTANERKAILTQINIIQEYRESYNGDIYEIKSSIDENGELTTELDDIVKYYDDEEIIGYRKLPVYIKR